MNHWYYIGSAYGNIVWKYVFLLHVLNKNENNINAGSPSNQHQYKHHPSKKNQSVLIVKISSRKTQKITNPQKYKLPQKFRATW